MNNKPIELKPTTTVNDESEIVLDIDEIEQLAKFLDVLLEADLSRQDNVGNGND